MKRKLKITSVLFAVLICSICMTSYAQTKPSPKTISGGVVNGKALSLPKPDYPDDARRSKVTGVVSVKVVIDETGKVVSAQAVGGPESISLRQAAEAAALKATFSPTRLSGQPAKVSGVINYNFVGKTNEEILRVMAVSTVFTIVRHFASDLDKFNTVFEGPEMLKEAPAEFPEFAKELTSIASLEKLPVDKRIEAIDNAVFSIRAKLNESDKWHFEIGQNFGDLLGPLMLLMASGGDASDFGKLDESALKLNLNKIRQLLLSSPPDFPADVLEKFKDFTSLGGKDNLLAPENMLEFSEKMMALLETISPESAK